MLVVGAGVSGLAFAEALGDADFVLVDAADEVGGYCRSVHRDGFVWDYAGHFFHFRHAEIEDELIRRIGPSRVRKVARRSKVLYKDRLIDFPFQRHIDQLDHDDFVDCLNGLGDSGHRRAAGLRAAAPAPGTARGSASSSWSRTTRRCTSTDLGRLGRRGDGSVLPARGPELPSSQDSAPSAPPTYNSTFVYPLGTARSEFARALPSASVPPGRTLLGEPVVGDRRAPPPRPHHATHHRVRVAGQLGPPAEPAGPSPGFPTIPVLYTYNKVLVFNLGFDRKGPRTSTGSTAPILGRLLPRRLLRQRLGAERPMSLYVEIGAAPTSHSPGRRPRREGVLGDLQRDGQSSRAPARRPSPRRARPRLRPHHPGLPRRDRCASRPRCAAQGVHSVGRYGGLDLLLDRGQPRRDPRPARRPSGRRAPREPS